MVPIFDISRILCLVRSAESKINKACSYPSWTDKDELSEKNILEGASFGSGVFLRADGSGGKKLAVVVSGTGEQMGRGDADRQWEGGRHGFWRDCGGTDSV